MKTSNILKTLILSCMLGSSYAMINIEPTIISLDDQNSSRIVTVHNPNDYKAYISIEKEIFSCKDGSFFCKSEDRVPYEDSENNLAFSMTKFILNPKQSKSLHVNWLGKQPNKTLHVSYYANDHAEQAITKVKQSSKENEKLSMSLSIITRQLADIIVQKEGAKEAEPKISVSDNYVVVENKGSSILLVKAFQEKCPKDSKLCRSNSRSEVIQPNSTGKYAVDPKHDISVRYFYQNKWINNNIKAAS